MGSMPVSPKLAQKTANSHAVMPHVPAGYILYASFLLFSVFLDCAAIFGVRHTCAALD